MMIGHKVGVPAHRIADSGRLDLSEKPSPAKGTLTKQMSAMSDASEVSDARRGVPSQDSSQNDVIASKRRPSFIGEMEMGNRRSRIGRGEGALRAMVVARMVVEKMVVEKMVVENWRSRYASQNKRPGHQSITVGQ